LTGQDYHAPVMKEQVLSLLLTDQSGVYIDGTVGGGGHAEAICRSLTESGRVIGFDQDEQAIEFTRQRLSGISSRVTLIRANFSALADQLRALGLAGVNGVLLDLGVSSYQLNQPELGFSYRTDGAVDMRMDRRRTLTGKEVINTYSDEELQRVIREFGEERYARRIARALVARRPIDTTLELRDAVGSAVGGRYLRKTLSRVFQAIRIEVNQELDRLAAVLPEILRALVPGGRVVVISYHSLEDRIVKNFFREQKGSLIIMTKKPMTASRAETEQNPRARSAKLRAAERATTL